MRTKQLLSLALMGAGLAQVFPAHAADKIWNVPNGDFTNPANWQGGLPSFGDIAIINNGGTSTVPATATTTFGTVKLGSTEGSGQSGHVIMNGGTLTIGGDPGDPKAVIGFSGTLSTFIMNGGTIYFDGPDQGFGGTGYKGVNELDWEVGEKGMGRFEMHGNAKFFGSDDLKVAENALGMGSVLIDGNAHLAVGSGISVSGGGPSVEQTLVIGGNAVVDSGNSMGAGVPEGGTDEGYLTMAFGGSTGKLTIQDNGILNIRRLSAREGNSTILVKDRGQFHIFELLTGAGTNAATRPVISGPNSTFVSAAGTGTLTLQDDAVMTVNSDPGGGTVQGLAIAGPRDSGNAGGKATFIIKDRASFRVEQNLGIGNGYNSESSDGTLEVVGPNAKINIGGNLNLAVNTDGEVVATDPEGNLKPGKATLSAVITGSTHATVNVAGMARIVNGRLKVKLDGYTPAAGNGFTLIKAGSFDGQFAQTDFSEAVLPDGLTWKVEQTADSVILKALSQPGLPKRPENSGVTVKSATLYANPEGTINNGSTESLGVAVLNNGNVVVGWEDDHDEDTSLEYLAAVWTMFDSNGNSITPPTAQPSLAVGGSITSKFLSYFRKDGSAVPGFTSWGPKIKANPYGDGFGMGATSYGLGFEVPELLALQNDASGENAGDFPSVQLLTGTGQPIAILTGVGEAYAERPGDIRIGDWEYLSNSNVVIVGESRQREDLFDIYQGANSGTHAIYRILDKSGNEVSPVKLVSAEPLGSEIWHGIGSVSNGFAIRTAIGGRGTIRLFANNGTATSGNIDLATVTGFEMNAAGGRGDGIGFHGNGKDAYVLAVAGNDVDGNPAIRVSVLNADGTLRYSKKVSDDVLVTGLGRVDAAIDQAGRVLVVYDAQLVFDDGSGTVTNPRIVMGRLIGADGTPEGGTFYVSEKELPAVGTLEARRPRVDLHNGVAAVTWETRNAGTEKRTVALRIFGTGGGSAEDLVLSIAKAGPNSLRLNWTGGAGPFLVQRKGKLTDATWMNVLTTTERTALVPNDGAAGFFRVMNSASTTVMPMSVVLGGAFEAPTAVTSPGVGRGTVSLEGNKLSFDIRYSGLSSAAVNMHIHGFGTTSQGVGVLSDIKAFNEGALGTSGRITGSVTLTEAQKAGVLAGDTYVNIHTANHPGGEIRGQITPAQLRATLNGANEKPNAVDTTATGTGTVTVVGDELFVDVSYTGLKGNINNAHIHGPAGVDATAGVLRDMAPLHVGAFGATTSGRFLGSVVVSPATLNAIVDGNAYFNIHSTAAPGGEIRGQIVP